MMQHLRETWLLYLLAAITLTMLVFACGCQSPGLDAVQAVQIPPAPPPPEVIAPKLDQAADDQQAVIDATRSETGKQRQAVVEIRTEDPNAPQVPLKQIEDSSQRIDRHMEILELQVQPAITGAAAGARTWETSYQKLVKQYEKLSRLLLRRDQELARLNNEHAAAVRDRLTWLAVIGFAATAGFLAFGVFSGNPRLFIIAAACAVFAGTMTGLAIWFKAIALISLIGIGVLMLGGVIWMAWLYRSRSRQFGEVVQLTEHVKEALGKANGEGKAARKQIFGGPRDKGEAGKLLSYDTQKAVARQRASKKTWLADSIHL